MSGNEPDNPYSPPNGGPTPDQPQADRPQYGERSENWTAHQPEAPSAQPQYGQRSESWTPGGPSAQEQPPTPWPVYGQNAAPHRQQSPYGGAPQPQYPGQQYPQQQVPQYGTPTPYGGSTQPTPAGQLPGRTGPVLTLIGGVVLMIIVAPMIFFSSFMGNIGLDKLTDGSLLTTNGGTVEVSGDGIIAIASAAGTPESCQLTSGSGQVTDLHPETEAGGAFVGRGLTKGSYTVECKGIPAGSEMVVMDSKFMGGLVKNTMSALGWSALAGLIGLGATIGGIIWLVQVNSKRRAYTQGRYY